MDETELDEKFSGFTAAVADKYRAVADEVKTKYEDAELDEKFEGLKGEVTAKFNELKGSFGKRDE